MWDEHFEPIIQSHLRNFRSALPLDPDLVLSAHGLDSMGMIGLISSLEKEYSITLPDEAVVPANFITPRTIWNLIQPLLLARVREPKKGESP